MTFLWKHDIEALEIISAGEGGAMTVAELMTNLREGDQLRLQRILNRLQDDGWVSVKEIPIIGKMYALTDRSRDFLSAYKRVHCFTH